MTPPSEDYTALFNINLPSKTATCKNCSKTYTFHPQVTGWILNTQKASPEQPRRNIRALFKQTTNGFRYRANFSNQILQSRKSCGFFGTPDLVWSQAISPYLVWSLFYKCGPCIVCRIFTITSSAYSHTPSALNAGAKRSDVPFGHASMLLLGEGSEATEPYNKYANLF